ncbi:MAG TPA: hypothetical protein VJU15_12250 [Gemmatimonadales bacterium]|nr:hypothetical protein [Gemmatimonadales bacterium]
MSNNRKFQDHEIRQILDLAIGQEDNPVQALPAADGLTLVQLQEVGREVGLSPDRISQAVAAFEGRGELVPRGTTLGLPTRLGRVVPLPRNLTDREWELLIAQLRTTFGAKGTVTSQGSLREWTHGTLHAFLEPTETGYRLRLTDSRVEALGAGLVLGGGVLTFGLIILIALLSKDVAGLKLLIPLMFSLGGGGVMALSAMSLPGWAREQEKRMEHISSYAASLIAPPQSKEE